jgi:hypothetical protein
MEISRIVNTLVTFKVLTAEHFSDSVGGFGAAVRSLENRARTDFARPRAARGGRENPVPSFANYRMRASNWRCRRRNSAVRRRHPAPTAPPAWRTARAGSAVERPIAPAAPGARARQTALTPLILARQVIVILERVTIT